jgi:hypothetical protein
MKRMSEKERRGMFARLNDVASFWPGLHKKNSGRFYRGTSKGKGIGFGALGAGLYLSWDKGMAKSFGKDVATYSLPKDLKLLDAQSKTMDDFKAQMGFKPEEYSDNPIYAKALKMMVAKKGYDGVISDELAEGIVVFDEKKAKKISPLARKTAIENLRYPGDELFFEYHCNESHDSAHAQWWYRSHQKVKVIGLAPNDGMDTPSLKERGDGGVPINYVVRWPDGFVGEVAEDELMNRKKDFYQPDPPKDVTLLPPSKAFGSEEDVLPFEQGYGKYEKKTKKVSPRLVKVYDKEGLARDVDLSSLPACDLPIDISRAVAARDVAAADALRAHKVVLDARETVRIKEFGARFDAAREFERELRVNGYRPKVTPSGTVIIYHGTSKENAEKILRDGVLKDFTFFSHAKDKSAFGSGGAKSYGPAVLKIEADPRDIWFNSGSGEIEAEGGLVRGIDGVWRKPKRVEV